MLKLFDPSLISICCRNFTAGPAFIIRNSISLWSWWFMAVEVVSTLNWAFSMWSGASDTESGARFPFHFFVPERGYLYFYYHSQRGNQKKMNRLISLQLSVSVC